MNITITPRGPAPLVMKITKQTNGSITCRLCVKTFKNIHEVTRHAPHCRGLNLINQVDFDKPEEKKDRKSMLQEAMSCLECNLLCDTKRVLDQHVYMMHSLDKSRIGLSQFTTKCFHCKKVSFLYTVHS